MCNYKHYRGGSAMKKRQYETPSISLNYFSADSVLMASFFSSNGLAAFKSEWLDGGSF